MHFVGKNVYLFLSLFLLSLLSVRGLSFGIHSFAYSLVSHFLYKSPIYTHPHWSHCHTLDVLSHEQRCPRTKPAPSHFCSTSATTFFAAIVLVSMVEIQTFHGINIVQVFGHFKGIEIGFGLESRICSPWSSWRPHNMATMKDGFELVVRHWIKREKFYDIKLMPRFPLIRNIHHRPNIA